MLLIDSLGFSELTSLVLLHLCWEMAGVLGTWQGWGSLLHLQSRNNESCIEVHCSCICRVWVSIFMWFGVCTQACEGQESDFSLGHFSTLYFKAGSATEAGAHICSWIGRWPVSCRDSPLSTPWHKDYRHVALCSVRYVGAPNPSPCPYADITNPWASSPFNSTSQFFTTNK